MVDIMYLKSPNKIDYYIVKNNFMELIAISKNLIYIMAEDEGIVEGAYKIIKINKEVFEKMKEVVIDKKRKELTDILKKVHLKNKKILENSSLQVRVNESMEHNSKFLEKRKQNYKDYFNKNQPILN